MPDDGITSFADAFAGAETELGLGDLGDTEAPLPGAEVEVESTDEQAAAATADKPEASDNGEDEALDLDGFEELFSEDAESAALDPTSDAFLDTQITIQTPAGPETITVREAQQGYLRQSDYTRKTQEVAETRKLTTQAVEFFEEFQKNPLEFTKVLATRAQLIEPGEMPVGNLDSLPSTEDFDSRVETAVQERLTNDPTMQSAKLAQAREAVRGEFVKIEEAHNTSLTDAQRTLVIREANKAGTTNLALVFDAMVGRLQTKQSRRGSAPARPTGGAGPVDKGSEEKIPQTVLEAIEMAEADLSRA